MTGITLGAGSSSNDHTLRKTAAPWNFVELDSTGGYHERYEAGKKIPLDWKKISRWKILDKESNLMTNLEKIGTIEKKKFDIEEVTGANQYVIPEGNEALSNIHNFHFTKLQKTMLTRPAFSSDGHHYPTGVKNATNAGKNPTKAWEKKKKPVVGKKTAKNQKTSETGYRIPQFADTQSSIQDGEMAQSRNADSNTIDQLQQTAKERKRYGSIKMESTPEKLYARTNTELGRAHPRADSILEGSHLGSIRQDQMFPATYIFDEALQPIDEYKKTIKSVSRSMTTFRDKSSEQKSDMGYDTEAERGLKGLSVRGSVGEIEKFEMEKTVMDNIRQTLRKAATCSENSSPIRALRGQIPKSELIPGDETRKSKASRGMDERSCAQVSSGGSSRTN